MGGKHAKIHRFPLNTNTWLTSATLPTLATIFALKTQKLTLDILRMTRQILQNFFFQGKACENEM